MISFMGQIKGRKSLFKYSTDLQNFQICFRKFRASLPLPFGFRWNPLCLRCCGLIILFLIHSSCKSDKCLLILRIVQFAFPSSCRMIGFDNAILQLRSCFEIFDFSISKSSTTFLDVMVVALLVPTYRIKLSGCFLIMVLCIDWYLQFCSAKVKNFNLSMLRR